MGELSPKMRSLFSICYYTGCQVSAVRQLRSEDVVGNTLALCKARDLLGLHGYSTHSNRRTWSIGGVRLKATQDPGQWLSMAALQGYLEVLEEAKVTAIATL